jgi:hypothetical protein
VCPFACRCNVGIPAKKNHSSRFACLSAGRLAEAGFSIHPFFGSVYELPGEHIFGGTMKTILFTLLVSVLLMQPALSQGWEPLYTMPAVVAGATSAASEGYGVHLVGVYSGVAKHFWVGNDNTVVWSTLAVSLGDPPYVAPQVTFHDGQVRVVMKMTISGVRKVRIYQSDDGGYAWTLLPEFTPPNNPAIFHLYAYTDRYGTHIVWDDTESEFDHNKEVYYVRCNPQAQFENFRNVTELSSPSQGAGPKVAVVANKACVAFTSNSWQLTSRDLNLDTGEWDSFYRFQTGSSVPYANVNIASIGQRFYVMGISDVIPCINCCFRSAIFAYRDVSDMSWPSSTQFCSGGGSLNKPNSLVASGGKLHFISMPSTDINPQGPQAWSYDPSQGTWVGPEVIEGYTGDQNPNSLMLTGGQFGNYYFFTGSSPSFHQHMRRNAFVPSITLTPSVIAGWNMTGIPVALFNLKKEQVYPTSVESGPFRYVGGYQTADALTNREGYFIKFSSPPPALSFNGARIDSMRMIARTGWNIIGSISTSVSTSSVTTDPPGILSTGQFFKYNNGYELTTVLEPGGGYWVKTSQNGRIILKDDGGDQPGGTGENPLASLDRFSVSDKEGRAQDMYVRNSSDVPEGGEEEMPPDPPGGEGFNISIGPGKFIESVSLGRGQVDQVPIAVKAANYPITLSWDIKPENGLRYSVRQGKVGKEEIIRIEGKGSITIKVLSDDVIHLEAELAAQNSSSAKQSVEVHEPRTYSLEPNYPNPFNPSTVIRYQIPDASYVSLKVYDPLGRVVATLVNEPKEAGYYEVTFDASSLGSGVYFYRMTAGTFTQVKKMLLMK